MYSKNGRVLHVAWERYWLCVGEVEGKKEDVGMGNYYYCTRIWQLKQGATAREVEHMASSSILETLRWIPGVQKVTLVHALGSEPRSYIMNLTFASRESYLYWRQVEDEATYYWEHFASVQAEWEQLCQLLVEYAGEVVLDASVESAGV